MAAAGRRLAAVLLTACGFVSLLPAADLCEGCWELGGRGSLLLPGGGSGLKTTEGIGAFAAFRFRPYWAIHFGLDRLPGSVEDGPDETLTLLMVRGAYTFRSSRDQRTRPFGYFGAGLIQDQVRPQSRSVATAVGRVTVRSGPDSDSGIVYTLGGGSLTSFGTRTWLRLEGQWITWATFGIGENSFRILATLSFRVGR
ncbi:MAG TPA: hypothetical protein VNI57_09970 [Candidatus Saccharimonadales bacterium]|nr:hypothetical protein [Candidatus Saccharimonadales bacterium]